MRRIRIILVLACAVMSLSAQEKTDGPTSEKAQKTYNEGLEYVHQRATGSALESFKKADKQDGGHCAACQQKMIKYGVELGD
jgi:outer membrane protein assembly factor BamD (BamD/ComL family)